MQITVTQATEKDTEAYEIQVWKPEDVVHYGREVSWQEWKPDFFIFKAEGDGKIVGVIGGHHIAGVIFIERIVVSPIVRGKGIGRQLVERAERYARSIGAHKIYLNTGKTWESNNFYKSLGYEKTADLPKHYHKVDFVIYSKFL
ncbi:MAG: hypothetical protein A2632_02340 [Candidatus Pacebacteria bacterium RIFCSPHIGHO2_01_FULL_46_16]|nr:MAG: hypothetical protein A2632_02340 [Candidatus Pacebacteria bacterium RIFCSPHIGHO2_01_FULL_46_16]OGJ22276.1 MAG: hypothetical protein A3J60_04135 [Candidatus Pacebacteria bacterium RIFCSPHIGHO2_02_FULL_46_9]OGJ38225.1 MAG: hypothetical protein A3A82_01300 [Candidatus Pacebacteria bacterium RIFCSPLOWO2_01_FULL_47_12]